MNTGGLDAVSSVPCPICAEQCTRIAASYPGYQRGLTYSLFACETCRYAFASPTRSEDAVYEAIYRQAALIPGYDRYDGYVRLVLSSSQPLDALAGSEEPYWALRAVVRELPPGARILDVGSGLGYVTYALSRAGYDATGLDISQNAVERARRRFGPHYVVADMFEWSKERESQYDLVTMLELIEHVENPALWIEHAFRMVKPGGALLLTTPNRDYYVDGAIWETDAPPVHLWWFSAVTLARMCASLPARYEIVDFTRCELPHATPYSETPVQTVRSPMLDEQGRPVSALRRFVAALGLLPLAKALYASAHKVPSTSPHPNPGTRETLAVLVRKLPEGLDV